MNIAHTKTSLRKVSDVIIPEEYFSRMKTGISQIDQVYGGEGILPGSVSTIAAPPGSGKTTLYLQICQSLEDSGYSAAYVTGEESEEMIAYSSKRLGVSDVLIANENNVDIIISHMEEVDFLVYDSFPCLTMNGKRLNMSGQEEAISKLVSAAKRTKTALTVVLHVTKGGGYKGSTAIPHAVDINMTIGVDDDDMTIRTISTSKNRYGSLYECATYFGAKGFDFSKTVVAADSTTAKSKSKSAKKDQELVEIMQINEPPGLDVSRVCSDLNIDATRANYLLRNLCQQGKLVKYGRGTTASWKHSM